MVEETREVWMQKPLHGQYPREVEEITKKEHAYRWTASTGLKIETEALITAAQDQALNTKYHKTKILRVSTDPKCRMCKLSDETISHITSACQNLAGTLYLKRHNDLASAIHRKVCQNYDFHVEPVPWQHKPNLVEENDKAKILWDFEIRTDRVMTARRPDLVIIDKGNKIATIVDVAVPSDTNIERKEREKIEKYQDLRLEVQRMWDVKAKVVPVVVGALGATTQNLDKHLEEIPGIHKAPDLLKAALLGTAHILRRFLDLPDSIPY
ncbi:hypothetical protein HOLleu_15434 [Holothuria leucospilota]|uniref:Reverse transcriptase n=1 Tax=Holothuria leucospilota TaxID=206669 RepID=A0A9Q1CAF8_HOLLE|nr:hypothetical protein HOLleu_15434 [Holothuria leucospilota]